MDILKNGENAEGEESAEIAESAENGESAESVEGAEIVEGAERFETRLILYWVVLSCRKCSMCRNCIVSR